ncbi:hypothetical protein EW145_g6941 [Phellinidium pouzarii]|uniref:DUF6534 domain-containing protein n=1 Tax=Phellinidium pouzarii TaxID=167371 RepID=A0A4S4KTE7_9AGAM|nr:hypothetical protein EW145_g6941 [Phellinidium pouzarii]
MSSEAAAPSLHLDSTYGVLFLALVITMALWGAGTVQLYYYHNKFGHTDEWWRRLIVFLIWALDTGHQICIIKPLYMDFVKNFDNPASLTHLDPASTDTVILAAFVDSLVQGLFLTRIWHLSRQNYVLTGSVIALVIAQFVSTMVYFGKENGFTDYTQLTKSVSVEHVATAIITVTDLVIASTLVWLLHSSRSGFKRTDTVINRLILYTVNTGLITGLCALAALVTGFALPNTSLYIFFLFVIPKLYLNCLLASLNSREHLRSTLEATDEFGMSVTASTLRAYPSRISSGMTKSQPNRPHHVDIRVETDTMADHEAQKHLERTQSASGSEDHMGKPEPI